MAKPNEVIGGLNNVESPEYRALNNVRRLEYRPPIAETLAHRGQPEPTGGGRRVSKTRLDFCAIWRCKKSRPEFVQKVENEKCCTNLDRIFVQVLELVIDKTGLQML